MRRRLRRHPRGGRPVAGRDRGERPRAGRRGDPARRPVRSRPQAGRQPGRAACRGARRPGAQARPPARPGVPGRAARAGPRLLPGRGLRRAAAAERPRHPGPRLGQPALLGAAGVARRRAGPARAVGGRRGHRRDHVPDRAGDGRRSDLRRDDRGGSGPSTPPATCSAGSPRAGPGCWSPPSTASRTAPSRPASSRPRGSASPRRSPSTTPGSTGPSRPRPSTGGSGPAPRRRVRGRPTRASGSSSVRSLPDPDHPALAPGRAGGHQAGGARRHRDRAGAAGGGQGVRQEGDGGDRLGPRHPPGARDPLGVIQRHAWVRVTGGSLNAGLLGKDHPCPS